MVDSRVEALDRVEDVVDALNGVCEALRYQRCSEDASDFAYVLMLTVDMQAKRLRDVARWLGKEAG